MISFIKNARLMLIVVDYLRNTQVFLPMYIFDVVVSIKQLRVLIE